MKENLFSVYIYIYPVIAIEYINIQMMSTSRIKKKIVKIIQYRKR